jgi:hypothetical protein
MATPRPSRPAHVPYVRVKVAIDSGDLGFLIHHAQELPRINLADALQICLLYRDHDSDRYDAAAVKWLMRFAAEAKEASLEDIQSAAAALDALPEQPQAAMEQLSSLCVQHGLTR